MMKRAATSKVAAFIEFLTSTALSIQSPLRARFFTGRWHDGPVSIEKSAQRIIFSHPPAATTEPRLNTAPPSQRVASINWNHPHPPVMRSDTA